MYKHVIIYDQADYPVAKRLRKLKIEEKKHRQIQGSVSIKLTISHQPKAADSYNWYQMIATIIFYTQLIQNVPKRNLPPSEYTDTDVYTGNGKRA